MKHSDKYEKVKFWYVLGVWNETRVRNAVLMKWLTEEEFTEITGKAY